MRWLSLDRILSDFVYVCMYLVPLFQMLPTVIDYRVHRLTPVPFQEINLKAYTLILLTQIDQSGVEPSSIPLSNRSDSSRTVPIVTRSDCIPFPFIDNGGTRRPLTPIKYMD